MPFSLNQSIFANVPTGDIVSKIARTATGASIWVDIGAGKEIVIQLQSDAGSGTTPTLDVKFQTSFNALDATAIDVPTGSFTQVLGAASAQIKTATAVHRFVKVVWTITGTTPSFNFGVYATSRS